MGIIHTMKKDEQTEIQDRKRPEEEEATEGEAPPSKRAKTETVQSDIDSDSHMIFTQTLLLRVLFLMGIQLSVICMVVNDSKYPFFKSFNKCRNL